MPLWSKVTSILLVILIGATASVLMIMNQGDRLREQVDAYPEQSTHITLSGLPEAKTTPVLSVFRSFVEAPRTGVVRIDAQQFDVDGGLSALRIGLLANPNTPPAGLDLRFLGTTLFDTGAISRLQKSDSAKSIGLDTNAADVISALPALTFAPRVSVVQLGHLVDSSGTVNGTYRIVGAGPDRVAELLRSLEKITGQSSETMLHPLGGQATDAGLAPVILLGCFIGASVLLVLLLIFEALRSLSVLGVHLLLGRSRWTFAVSMFMPVLIGVALSTAISTALSVLLARGYDVNTTLLAAASGAAVAGVAPAVVGIAIAALMVCSTRPVTAILGRYSKRMLLWTLGGFYVSAVAGFSVLLMYIDGPLRKVDQLADVQRTWSAVADEQILYHLSAGNDQASMSGQSIQLASDFYRWYSSICDDPGVTLINTVYYDQQILDGWSGVFKSVPTRPFWFMAASPSYLAAQGFSVPDDDVTRAEEGERIFFVPESWSDTEKTAIKGWLPEHGPMAPGPAIRTSYFDNGKISFEEYAPKVPLFTWSTDTAQPQKTNEPVILLTTPQNMVPFESESLYASGLENSYVKLTHSAAKDYTSREYLARYHLDDNQVTFLTVGDFVAGLTKSIQSVLQLFGGVILFFSVVLLVALSAMTKLFTTTRREALAVKRSLGYSLVRLFGPVAIVIASTAVLALFAGIVFRSASGVLGNALLLVVETVIVSVMARRSSRSQLSGMLKE